MSRTTVFRMRSAALALAASAALIGGVAVQAQAAPAPTGSAAAAVPGGAHKYVNAATGKCLDIQGASRDPGALVQQFSCKTGYQQEFATLFGADGLTRMQPRHSGKCIGAAGTAPGSQVTQQVCHDGAIQRWDLVDLGGGQVAVRNAATGLCLDDGANPSGSRREVRQVVCTGSSTQNWVRYAV
ncbi:RICIN domain-containing protein [Streptomyces sp. NPDC089799]|uniref:RICIN domain-containing protein n=1 Tax=Streptomyces sp. NPDC089799 TaxID=3155066 RepID=UPI003435B27E